MLLKINVTCPSCSSGDVVIEDNNILICKNMKCDDFNCFYEMHTRYFRDYIQNNITIENGLTGELTFENEEGKFYERYENGKIVEERRL